MAVAHIASTIKGSVSLSLAVTTDAIDTTGANLLVVSLAKNGTPTVTLSDSKGNTWTALTERSSSSQYNQLYYCLAPVVGSGHTVTATYSGAAYHVVGVAAFSGVAAFESQSGFAGASGTSRQPGSVTPVANGALIVSALNCGAGTAISINSGFTAQALSYSVGHNIGSGLAYLAQSTAAAVNPTWTWTTSGANASTIAVFSGAVTAATTTTLSGPAAGESGVASSNFSVALDGAYTGTITPATSGSGTFTPTSLTWAGTSETKTFTYTPAGIGAHSISISESPDLTTSGSPIAYTASSFATVTIADADWFFSPYNWLKTGSTRAETNTPGAYFKARVSGTSCKMTLDVSHLAAVTAGNYPTIEWQIDGGAKTRVQLTSSTTQIDFGTLSDASHDLFVQLVGAWWQNDRWTTPVQSLRVTSLVLNGGEALSAPTLLSGRMLIFGDSHCEGYEALTAGVSVANQDAGDAYGNLLASRFNCEYGIIGFAGQGYTAGGGGSVPDCEDAWDFYWSGQSRLSAGLLSPTPSYIISCHGDNDSTGAALTTAVASCISQWRAAAPSAAIVVCVPPNRDAEGKQSEIQDGVTAAADARAYFIDTGVNLLVAGPYLNGGHLSTAGHIQYADLIGDGMDAAITTTYTLRVRAYNGSGAVGVAATTTFEV